MYLDNVLGSSKREIWEALKARHPEVKHREFVIALNKTIKGSQTIEQTSLKLYRVEQSF